MCCQRRPRPARRRVAAAAHTRAFIRKLINHTDTVLTESPDGFATAHSDIVSLGKLTSAEVIPAELTGAILNDLALPRGQPMILLANGFGGTPTDGGRRKPADAEDAPMQTAALRWGVSARGDGAARGAPTKAGPARENAVPVRVARSGWPPRKSVRSCDTQGRCTAS